MKRERNEDFAHTGPSRRLKTLITFHKQKSLLDNGTELSIGAPG